MEKNKEEGFAALVEEARLLVGQYVHLCEWGLSVRIILNWYDVISGN
jgi:hypothetical protein